MTTSTKRLSVIVPAYNEEKTIVRVLRNVLQLDGLLEVIVIDDASVDRTSELAWELASLHPQVTVLRHTLNQGKTQALKTGFAASRGDVVIVQDADLEYDPSEIPGVVDLILTGRADVVYGSRFQVRKAARVLYYYHYLANQALTFLSDLFTNLNLTDVETGYKAFRGDIIRSMVISSSGFGFEIEVTAKVAKLKCAIYEVPISYYGRTYEEGKKIGPIDGLAALWYIFYYNLLVTGERSFRNFATLRQNLQEQFETSVEKARSDEPSLRA